MSGMFYLVPFAGVNGAKRSYHVGRKQEVQSKRHRQFDHARRSLGLHDHEFYARAAQEAKPPISANQSLEDCKRHAKSLADTGRFSASSYAHILIDKTLNIRERVPSKVKQKRRAYIPSRSTHDISARTD